VKQRHPEWQEFQKHWRWLYDSYEAGDRYRYADYFRGPFEPWVDPLYAFGWDQTTGEGYPFSYGMIVQRNLVPHLSEKSTEGRDVYVLRLNRTPVPALVEYVVDRWLSRVFSQRVVRTGPPALEAWWGDADGKGTPATKWFRETVHPLLLALGQLDLVFGRPAAGPGEENDVLTRADLKRLGLDGVVASYILPENMVWWRKDRADAYAECLVHERDDRGNTVWRHWTADEANAYDGGGNHLPQVSWVHGLGFVPIRRVFDRRLQRCTHVGKSRLGAVAELQKSIYNRKSELQLDDVQQSHAVLQGPEDFMQADATISVGPGGALPKKKNTVGNSVSYEGWEFIDPPKTGSDSLRQNISDDLDSVLLHAGLLKPAGATNGTTVAQSGVSKGYDARDGANLLSEVAATLGEAELAAAAVVAEVLGLDPGSIEVEYPSEFEAAGPDEIAGTLDDLQRIAGGLGHLPETEGEALKRLVTVALPGVPEKRLRELHDEVTGTARRYAEGRQDGSENEDVEAAGSAGQNATQDPSITLPPDAAQAVAALQTVIAPEMV
jgi:hypothetical protein